MQLLPAAAFFMKYYTVYAEKNIFYTVDGKYGTYFVKKIFKNLFPKYFFYSIINITALKITFCFARHLLCRQSFGRRTVV